MRLGACVIAVNECLTVRAVLAPLVDRCDATVLVTGTKLYPARGGHQLNDDGTATIGRDVGAHVIEGEWPDQHTQREAGMEWLRDQDCDVAFMLDGDEVYLREQVDAMREHFERKQAGVYVARSFDYFRLPCWRVDAVREHWFPVAIDLHRVRCSGTRCIRDHAPILSRHDGYERAELPDTMWPRHYTWVRSNQGVDEKLLKSEDRESLDPDWLRQHWYQWTKDDVNFWPYNGASHAGVYPRVVREDVPAEIRAELDVPNEGEW